MTNWFPLTFKNEIWWKFFFLIWRMLICIGESLDGPHKSNLCCARPSNTIRLIRAVSSISTPRLLVWTMFRAVQRCSSTLWGWKRQKAGEKFETARHGVYPVAVHKIVIYSKCAQYFKMRNILILSPAFFKRLKQRSWQI